jgi:hypothetical protein
LLLIHLKNVSYNYILLKTATWIIWASWFIVQCQRIYKGIKRCVINKSMLPVFEMKFQHLLYFFLGKIIKRSLEWLFFIFRHWIIFNIVQDFKLQHFSWCLPNKKACKIKLHHQYLCLQAQMCCLSAVSWMEVSQNDLCLKDKGTAVPRNSILNSFLLFKDLNWKCMSLCWHYILPWYMDTHNFIMSSYSYTCPYCILFQFWRNLYLLWWWDRNKLCDTFVLWFDTERRLASNF